jgi:hypothetical protein
VFQRTGRTGFLARTALDAFIDVRDSGLYIDHLEALSRTAVLAFAVAVAKVVVDVDLTTDIFALPALDYHSLTSGDTWKAGLIYMAFPSRNV